MPRKRRKAGSRGGGLKGGLLGETEFQAESTFKPQPDKLAWLPTITPPATPLKDPFEVLSRSNLSAAEREKRERVTKESREKVLRMLGLAPDVSDEELLQAILREQRLNERAGAKSRAGAKLGGRPKILNAISGWPKNFKGAARNQSYQIPL
jgi:hypothetical protein